MNRRYILFLLGFCFPLINFAQLSIEVDRQTAIYQTGEYIRFNVSYSSDRTLSYRIYHDRFGTSLHQGTVEVEAGIPTPVVYKADQPGVYFCAVYRNSQSAIAAATVAPFEIRYKEAEPADLDAFWSNQLAELSTIPIDPVLDFEEEDEYTESYKFSLATVKNRRVYGYLSIPKSTGPHPAIVSFPAFGSDKNLVKASPTIAERGGAIHLNLSIHNAEPDEEDAEAYQPDDYTNRDSLYFVLAVLAGVRAIDYVFTRADFDSQNIGVNGVSQGGGLAILLAGLDERGKALVYSNPALCFHQGYKYDLANGFPYYGLKSNTHDGSSDHLDITIQETKYIDAAYFAKRFEGPSLGIVSYIDTICPAHTTFTAFNELKGAKTLVHIKKMGHSHPNDYWKGRLDLYRQLFPAMQSPPFPWEDINTGYLADAGPDQNVSTNQAIAISGNISYNGEINSNWKVQWSLEEGPGSIQFTNATQRNTEVTFSKPGNYQIRFTAFNDDLITEEGEDARLITITDYVTFTVN